MLFPVSSAFLSFSLVYIVLYLLLFFFLWFPLPNEKTFCAIVDWNALLRNVLLVTAQCYGTKGKEKTECRSVHIKYSFTDCVVLRRERGFESRYTCISRQPQNIWRYVCINIRSSILGWTLDRCASNEALPTARATVDAEFSGRGVLDMCSLTLSPGW